MPRELIILICVDSADFLLGAEDLYCLVLIPRASYNKLVHILYMNHGPLKIL